MRRFDASRRAVLRGGLMAGIAVYLAPLGSADYAALFQGKLLTPPSWDPAGHSLRFRVEGIVKVKREKVFARDFRTVRRWRAVGEKNSDDYIGQILGAGPQTCVLSASASQQRRRHVLQCRGRAGGSHRRFRER